MKLTTAIAVLFALPCFCVDADADIFGDGGNQFAIEFVTVGDPGNFADSSGEPNMAGSVAYEYRMGIYEISREMVTTKADVAGNLMITLADMTQYGGNHPDIPATGVSWNEAARFVNWLNTSQGHQAAYKFSTQPGDADYDPNENILLWQEGDPGFDANNPFRNSLALYFLPNVDEWYKAAYYDPNANGGAGGYWEFPTGSDSAPLPVARGTDPGTAVYLQPINQGPADITGAGGLSPYGVMGMGGNVWEWEQTEWDLVNDNGSSNRGVRGGGWINLSIGLSASNRLLDGPMDESDIIGFRVASIPHLRVCATNGALLKGTGEINDFSATCGSDDTYWAAHGATIFYQLVDPVSEFELVTAAPANFDGTTISVDVEASKENRNGNLNLRAMLFNFTTVSYEALPGVLMLSTTDTIQNFALPDGADPADFIEPSTDEVRLLLQTIQVSGSPNTRIQLDEVLFNFE